MRLTFHGAAESVTGSLHLIETTRAKILVDCGAMQGERMCATSNLEPFPFDPKTIDAVIVTHAHFDHTGRLPQLVGQGFAGPIFMTPPTKGITEIVLLDSLNIMRENAKRCGDPVPFTEEELQMMLTRIKTMNYHTEFFPGPGIRAKFFDAGHILGSSFVSLTIDGDQTLLGRDATVIVSGDIGNDDVPILPDTEEIPRADIVICEATYGGKEHEPTHVRSSALAEIVGRVIQRGGTLLIPAFSVERTQELLYELDLLIAAKKIPHCPIYLDSPLAIRATAIYREFKSYLQFDHPAVSSDGDFFSFPSLKETLSAEESEIVLGDRRPKIVIAGNGMMTGGRILRHLQRHLSDEKSAVLIVGFQAPYTLGRKLQEGAKEVQIYKQTVSVAAEIASIEAFSAHGDRKKLAHWLHPQSGSLPEVFLVHGENPTKAAFVDYLNGQGFQRVRVPHIHETFER